MRIGPGLRTAATLGALTIVLLLGLVWGWTKLTEPLPKLSGDSPAPTAACTVKTIAKGTRLTVGDVTVSVFNAGVTDGLATRTLNQLGARGFSPGDSGNAPATAKVDRVQIWAADRTNPAVQLVLRHLDPSVKVTETGGRALGSGIVIVVGNDFTRVRPGPDSIPVRADAEVCVAN